MKKILFIKLLIFWSQILIAQNLPTDIKFKNLTSKDGLPDESINSITQDSRGFMWFGSKEGLIRYDGKEFKAWYANKKDSNNFKYNNLTVGDEIKPNVIPFNSGGDLFTINGLNKRIERVQSFKNKILHSLPVKINENQHIVIGLNTAYFTDNDLIITDSIDLTPYFKPNNQLIHFKLYDPYLLIFSVIYNERVILNIDNKTIVKLNIDITLPLKAQNIHPKIFSQKTKKLFFNNYFTGWFSVVLDLTNQTNYTAYKEPLLLDGTTRAALLYEDQLILQGGHNGLYISNNTKYINYHQNSLSDKPILNNGISAIFKDNVNNIWLGTSKGLSIFNLKEPSIKYIKNDIFFKNDKVVDIEIDNKGTTYLLMLNKSINRINADNSFTQLDNSIGYTWNSIIENDEITAVGGGNRIVKYNIKTGNKENPTFLKPFYGNADLITLAYKANKGDMWYSINDGGGLVYNPSGTKKLLHYTNHSRTPSFSHRHFNAIAEDSKGNIWFGYIRNNKLLKWDIATKKFEEIEVSKLAKSFQSSGGIDYLFMDSDDNLWVVVGGLGLIKYNTLNKDGLHFDISNGLPTTDVSRVVEDDKKRIWITTGKGLSCYETLQNRFTTFTDNDGLPEEPFKIETIVFNKQNKLLYLGGYNSLAWFNPDSLMLSKTVKQPGVFIDELFVNNEKFYFNASKKTNLNPSQDNLQFNIAAVDYIGNNQLVFQYKLVGGANVWVNLEKIRAVNFSNLRSGQYELSVRCKYFGTEKWFETATPFYFMIKTAWNRSWWFFTLIGLAILGFAWWINRAYYLRKIENQKAIVEKQLAVEAERNRIAADMHDDLGSGLTKITYLSQMALSSMDKEKNIEKINKTSAELVDNMSEIIWAMKEENNNLSDLILHIKNYIIEYCIDNNLECILNFETNYKERIVKGENRRHIYLVIKEIFHNIVKHSNATKVTVDVTYESTWKIAIKDNGIGFEKNNSNPLNGNGLKNIAKRIQAVNGTVVYENNNGTMITIQIPI